MKDKISIHQKKQALLAGVVLLALILGCAVYYLSHTKATDAFYNESLRGIPHLKNQTLVQGDMYEYGNGSTGGTLSYFVEDSSLNASKAASYFQRHTDRERWTVEAVGSNDKLTRQLQYTSADKEVRSTTCITISESEQGLVIQIQSYYE